MRALRPAAGLQQACIGARRHKEAASPEAVAVRPAFLCVVQPSGPRLSRNTAAAELECMVTLSHLVGHWLLGPFQLAASLQVAVYTQ